ncbi:hypothetical protein A9G42_04755 [Gilliamella sp. Nev6-6]|nr:NTF2 fold immunity protein [Gilliamella apicola]OCG67268.1 hypothetical protein A9G30_05825 [Gilliamella apicola]OCG77758.1 hypothetical protein A9G42_04755 [Gilliamella apicola]
MNIEIAKNILKEFIIAMNHWEIRCYPKLKSDSSEEAYLQMTKDLNFIFDKFCTKKNENMIDKQHYLVETHQSTHQMKKY